MSHIKLSEDLIPLIPKFIKNRYAEVGEIRKYYLENNCDEISKVGHKIKGAAGGYGFDLISQYGKEIEENALEGNFEKIEEICKKIEAYFDNLEIEYIEEEF